MRSMYEAHLWLAGVLAVVVGMHVTLQSVQPTAERPQLPEPPVWVSHEVDQKQVLLQWNTAPENEVIVERRVESARWDEITTVKDAQEYRDAKVEPGKGYSYRLRSRNRRGPSLNWSAEQSVKLEPIQVAAIPTPQQNPVVPPKVTPLMPMVKVDPPMPPMGKAPNALAKVNVKATSEMVTLSWSSVSGADKILIHRKRDEASAYEPAIEISAAMISWIDAKVEPGKKYGYQVVAKNQYGVSKGVEESVQVPPSKLQEIKAVAVSPTKIEITWEKPKLNDVKVIIEKSNDTTNYVEKKRLPDNETSYTEDNLSADFKYQYRFTVVLNDTRSESVIVDVKTLPKAPVPMAKLEGDNLILAIHSTESKTETKDMIQGLKAIEANEEMTKKLVGKQVFVLQQDGIVPLSKCVPTEKKLNGADPAKFFDIKDAVDKLMGKGWLENPKSHVIILWSTNTHPKHFELNDLTKQLDPLGKRTQLLVLRHKDGPKVIPGRTSYLDVFDSKSSPNKVNELIPRP